MDFREKQPNGFDETHNLYQILNQLINKIVNTIVNHLINSWSIPKEEV